MHNIEITYMPHVTSFFLIISVINDYRVLYHYHLSVKWYRTDIVPPVHAFSSTDTLFWVREVAFLLLDDKHKQRSTKVCVKLI